MTIKEGMSFLGKVAVNQIQKANDSRRWSLVLAVFGIQVLEIAMKMGDAVIISWTGVCGVVVGFFFAKHETPTAQEPQLTVTSTSHNETVTMEGK